MEEERKTGEDKKIKVNFSSTHEMSAKNAIKLMLDTYNEVTEEYKEYKKAQ